MKEKSELATITGLVTPAEWDEDGNPTEVKICTPGEVDYLVIKNKKSAQLLKHLKEVIKVKGFIKTMYSQNTIEVQTIKKTKEEEEWKPYSN